MASSFLEIALGTRLSTSSTFQTHFMPYKFIRVTHRRGEMSPPLKTIQGITEQRELVGTTIFLY